MVTGQTYGELAHAAARIASFAGAGLASLLLIPFAAHLFFGSGESVLYWVWFMFLLLAPVGWLVALRRPIWGIAISSFALLPFSLLAIIAPVASLFWLCWIPGILHLTAWRLAKSPRRDHIDAC